MTNDVLRYINQYQTLLEEEDKYPSRQEREVYAKAILTATGDRPDWDIAPPDETDTKYVQILQQESVDKMYRENNSGKEAGHHTSSLTSYTSGTTANYENWVKNGTLRKVPSEYFYI